MATTKSAKQRSSEAAAAGPPKAAEMAASVDPACNPDKIPNAAGDQAGLTRDEVLAALKAGEFHGREWLEEWYDANHLAVEAIWDRKDFRKSEEERVATIIAEESDELERKIESAALAATAAVIQRLAALPGLPRRP